MRWQTAILLLGLIWLPLALAGWRTEKTTVGGEEVKTYSEGSFSIALTTVANDPVYDLSKVDASAFLKTDGTIDYASAKTSLPSQLTSSKLHSTSLNVVVKYGEKVILTVAEGKTTKLIKSAISGMSKDQRKEKIPSSAISELETAVKTFSDSDSRITHRIKSLAAMLKEATSRSGFVFKETRRKSSQKMLTSTKKARTEIPGDYAFYYEVRIYIGHAFNIQGSGHHSATSIDFMVRHPDGRDVSFTDIHCNHGRCPTDEGMTRDCKHTGEEFAMTTEVYPTNWDCTTSYWPVFCNNLLGASHNCNANTNFQINVSDSPLNPPATDQGICAADCPRRAPLDRCN